MPLRDCKQLKGEEKKQCIRDNIRQLRKEGKPQDQAVAIAMQKAGMRKKRSRL